LRSATILKEQGVLAGNLPLRGKKNDEGKY
jgi:hypothetical protein